MAEIQKIGEWFFASDRVMTINAREGRTTEGLFVFALPLPYCEIEDGEIVEYDLAHISENWYAEDIRWACAKVALDGEKIVCDIPDNCALFICDTEIGTPDEREGEELIVHWSKR